MEYKEIYNFRVALMLLKNGFNIEKVILNERKEKMVFCFNHTIEIIEFIENFKNNNPLSEEKKFRSNEYYRNNK